MAYVKKNWVTDEVITENDLDHLETQFDEVKNELEKTDGSSAIQVHGSNLANGSVPLSKMEINVSAARQGARNIWVQQAEPTALEVGDLWFKLPQQSQLVLQPGPTEGKDAYVNSASPDTNFGTDVRLRNFRDGSTPSRESYIQFDLSGIPPGSVIVSAVLRLSAAGSAPSVGSVTLYRVTQAWDQNTITFNNKPTFDPNNSVNSQDDPLDPSYQIADITSFVQKWISGEWENHGMRMYPIQDVLSTDFDSSNYSVPSERPKLTIDYLSPGEILFWDGQAWERIV